MLATSSGGPWSGSPTTTRSVTPGESDHWTGRSRGRRFDLRPGDPEWVAEADRRHAEILHFGAPLNYRLRENRRGRRWTPGEPW